MMINCCVLGCQKSMRTDSSLTYFTLPSDEKRCAVWLNAINRKDISTSGHEKKTYRVCESHFEPKHIIENLRRKRLKQNAVPTLEIQNLDDMNKGTQTDNSLSVYSRLVPQLKVTQMEIISIDPEPTWNTTEDDNLSCNSLSMADIKPVYNNLTIDEYSELSTENVELPCSPLSIEDIKPPRSLLSIEDNKHTGSDESSELTEPTCSSFCKEVIQSPSRQLPVENIKLNFFSKEDNPTCSNVSRAEFEPSCNTLSKVDTESSYENFSEDSKHTHETLSIDFKLSCGILSIDPNPKPICRIVSIESKPNCRFLTINPELTCSTSFEDSVSFCNTLSSDAEPVHNTSPTSSESACRTEPEPIFNAIAMASSSTSFIDPKTASQNSKIKSSSQNSKKICKEEVNSESISSQTSSMPVLRNRPQKRVLTRYIHENKYELLEEKPKRKVAKRS